MHKTKISTHFILAMVRAVYLVTRIYLGLVVHFGRVGTIIGFLLCFLTTDALRYALAALAVTLGHYVAVRLLDAGYRRCTAAIVRPRKPVPARRKAVVKTSPGRAANGVQSNRAAPLRLHSVGLSNFNHLHP